MKLILMSISEVSLAVAYDMWKAAEGSSYLFQRLFFLFFCLSKHFTRSRVSLLMVVVLFSF